MAEKINSVILLRNVENGQWHYSPRWTTVEETKQELKEHPYDFGELYSYHGIFGSWLEAAKVSNQIHEKEIEGAVGQKLHPINKSLYD